MQAWAKSFYFSPAWRSCRAAYIKSVGGLCERCLARGVYRSGEIVHHKIHLTPENMNDPNIALNWDNLEAVCRLHHAELHEGQNRKPRRYTVDLFGRVEVRDIPPVTA